MLITVLLLLGATLRAQVNVEISGEGANLAGRKLELLCYDDMLTLHESLLDSAVADSAGRFSLGCYLTYPRLVVVQAECYSQSFYVEPGRRYEVWLPEFQWDQDESHNVYLDPVALPFEFLNLPADELNLRMMRLDDAIDSFVSVHRVHFDPKFKPSRRWMDTLQMSLQGAGLLEGQDSFYVRYARYTLAQMRYDMGFASRAHMLRSVIPQPVLYHDECYMRTLFDVLGGMVSQGTRKVGKHRLAEWVRAGAIDRYMDSLGTDPLLYDEQLRELAALVALNESLYDPDYDRDGVLRMLTALGTRSKWKEHRQLAVRLVAGCPAVGAEGAGLVPARWPLAGVVLPDADRRMVGLDSLSGRWVYLSFVRVDDPNSLRELEALAHFKDSVYAHHDDVVFVTVACDRQFQKMYHLLRNSRRGSRYSWTWLHFDGNYRWLERMGVVSYPTFILFDPEGRQPYSVTPWPGSGMLLHAPWEKPAVEREKLEFTD